MGRTRRVISMILKLYRKKSSENAILFLLFSLLGAVISMVLFVQDNNASLFQNQLAQSGFMDGMESTEAMEGFSIAYQSTENILGMIAVAAIFVGASGGLSLIGFRNSSSEKSIVMMHIFGMQKKDLVIKALMDALLYGLFSSCAGYVCGHLLFLHFSRNILQTESLVAFLSIQSAAVFCKTLGLIAFIVFWGNLYIDFRMTEQPIAQILYQRKGSGEGHQHLFILTAEVVGIVLYALFVFHVKKSYLFAAGVVAGLLSVILFLVFHFFFGVFTKKRRQTMKISHAGDLSFCFLCSRNKRDALLSVVISVGTILLCLAANIGFNISGVLRSAYQDNVGYTALIRVDDFEQKEDVKNRLDEQGITYTFGYSKLVDYSQLNHMGDEKGAFWALVIDSQTDGNRHFSVPAKSFLAENYFTNRCKLAAGLESDIFGSRAVYLGNLEDNQYLSLVSYNFIINKDDWKLGMDDSWSAIFLIDTSVSEEEEIESLLAGLACHMESASELIDELKEGMSDYFDILILVTGMIVLVTAAVFYTIIRSDLTNRRTEMYLYRVFGASFPKARKVIFYEYTLIALISSFAVSFTIMICGELYFYFGLKKHFPLSIPIVAVTTMSAVIFIYLCCLAAGDVNERNTGLEVIRDE